MQTFGDLIKDFTPSTYEEFRVANILSLENTTKEQLHLYHLSSNTYLLSKVLFLGNLFKPLGCEVYYTTHPTLGSKSSSNHITVGYGGHACYNLSVIHLMYLNRMLNQTCLYKVIYGLTFAFHIFEELEIPFESIPPTDIYFDDKFELKYVSSDNFFFEHFLFERVSSAFGSEYFHNKKFTCGDLKQANYGIFAMLIEFLFSHKEFPRCSNENIFNDYLSYVSEEYQKILKMCVNEDIKSRPTFKTILEILNDEVYYDISNLDVINDYKTRLNSLKLIGKNDPNFCRLKEHFILHDRVMFNFQGKGTDDDFFDFPLVYKIKKESSELQAEIERLKEENEKLRIENENYRKTVVRLRGKKKY
ncbi:hypothetical protein TRFO_26113 [Tritrichomonas foetus]|uniref:Protein kinase domain-containing protein n=1 Tax=Tritrichomonas foetus TaxID=1144522 RepID=A0A1J4K8H3_9EUKA|nr:hypothetical protein TRFO_26113 [Tritrichomonas foetus]|eukprot:OHT05966.1 hypothetical protein TRFO_26113 [Tritrichomonas foetus]